MGYAQIMTLRGNPTNVAYCAQLGPADRRPSVAAAVEPAREPDAADGFALVTRTKRDAAATRHNEVAAADRAAATNEHQTLTQRTPHLGTCRQALF